MDQQEIGWLVDSIQNNNRVSGYTHNFYKYPARLSPSFAKQVIELFSEHGDLVVDPFMGGGTVLIEANALGRRAIGTDISELATFVSTVKTTLYYDDDLKLILYWLDEVLPKLNLHRKSNSPTEWINQGYLKNFQSKDTWPIRKLIELYLSEIPRLQTKKAQNFARCVLLRTVQWAIDSRHDIPSVKEIREQILKNYSYFSEGARDFLKAVSHNDNVWKKNKDDRIRCLNVSSESLYKHMDESPKLVLTSPPYPGVHVLYHRWQVRGRRETPVPFWIADCKDGHSGSYYTLGGRSETGKLNYFDNIKETMQSLVSICDNLTVIVQVLAFSEPKVQFPLYLEIMHQVGLREIFPLNQEGSSRGRLWRQVPNRKWYTHEETPSSREVVLFHKKR